MVVLQGCGRFLNYHFTGNLLLNLQVKEFKKIVFGEVVNKSMCDASFLSHTVVSLFIIISFIIVVMP